MELRDASPGDAGAIREIARESLTESYDHVLDGGEIETILGQWYDDEHIREFLDEGRSILVIADDGEPRGYVEGTVLNGDTVIGDIQWLHVRPAARNRGYGVQLLGEAIDRMENAGASTVRGHIVDVNEAGAAFYEAHGFERRSTRPVTIAGEDYEEVIYERRVGAGTDEDVLETVEGPDGQRLHVDYADGQTGVKAPLYPTYTDPERTEQYGWYCSNCGSTETTMDAAGRIECADCGNTRQATRWDGSYL